MKRSSYRDLLPYLRPHWRTIATALGCTIVFTVCWPLLAALAGKLLGFLVKGDVPSLARAAGVVAGIFFVQKLAQYGQDSLMAKAALAIAHLKLGLFLEETGYQFDSRKRLGVYLTNTLDDAQRRSETLFQEFIADEANEAVSVKLDVPVMVVVGNPPYSGHSENKSAWVSGLVKDYYVVDGLPMGEKNPKWLQDDYVKFMRFSPWRIDKTGVGILAFVTNHGYLDNLTFRGMRQSLAKTFDWIRVLDLHGNSKKKETAIDGSKDEMCLIFNKV